MNAPAAHLPFGLVPYAEGQFESFHAAGSMMLTASMLPALFGVSSWASRYALAAHIKGVVPLVEPDHGRVEAGRWLEPVAIAMRREGRGSGRQVRAYARHATLPLIASPDALIEEDGRAGPLQVKVLTPRRFREEWAGGPPLPVQIQTQAEFACCPGAAFGEIGALVVGDFDFFLEIHRTAPHPGAIRRLEREVAAFMADLAAGRMPEPDDGHDSTARALEALFAPDAGSVVRLDEPEAAERLEAWRQATLDRKAAEAREAACKRWFLARIGGAGRVLVGNGGEIRRKRHKVSLKATADRETFQTKWTLGDAAEAEEEW